jgi:hypothetical protein
VLCETVGRIGVGQHIRQIRRLRLGEDEIVGLDSKAFHQAMIPYAAIGP